jgi:TIR domain
MGDIRLFVSHSHYDKKIAAALVDVIEATMVPRERILCTSHDNPKYREPEGVDVSRYLRDHLTQSSCVIGLLTPNSMKSPWCLFELGGAWALATRTYPLLAGGLSQEDLPAALKGTDAAQLTESEEIRRVLANVRRALGWDQRVKGSAAKEIDHLLYLVRSCSWALP